MKFGGLSAELEPNGPTPCFCADCMKQGGRERERLRAQWFRSTRRLVTFGKNAAARERRPR